MSSAGQANIDGIGLLTYQRAIDIARNTEGDLHSGINLYLEGAIRDIWARIEANPTTYTLTRDEFPVFNFYRTRFDTAIAEQAIDRYWRNTGQQRPDRHQNSTPDSPKRALFTAVRADHRVENDADEHLRDHVHGVLQALPGKAEHSTTGHRTNAREEMTREVAEQTPSYRIGQISLRQSGSQAHDKDAVRADADSKLDDVVLSLSEGNEDQQGAAPVVPSSLATGSSQQPEKLIDENTWHNVDSDFHERVVARQYNFPDSETRNLPSTFYLESMTSSMPVSISRARSSLHNPHSADIHKRWTARQSNFPDFGILDLPSTYDSLPTTSLIQSERIAPTGIHQCSLCDKEFKRGVDLTKHLKTHERPWKCPDEKCKYHEYGWPTEKERDRHFNDKHSATPMLYRCPFSPCPYSSRRKSNCKQHMEKVHGREYVRSKNNGKGRSSKSASTDDVLPSVTELWDHAKQHIISSFTGTDLDRDFIEVDGSTDHDVKIILPADRSFNTADSTYDSSKSAQSTASDEPEPSVADAGFNFLSFPSMKLHRIGQTLDSKDSAFFSARRRKNMQRRATAMGLITTETPQSPPNQLGLSDRSRAISVSAHYIPPISSILELIGDDSVSRRTHRPLPIIRVAGTPIPLSDSIVVESQPIMLSPTRKSENKQSTKNPRFAASERLALADFRLDTSHNSNEEEMAQRERDRAIYRRWRDALPQSKVETFLREEADRLQRRAARDPSRPSLISSQNAEKHINTVPSPIFTHPSVLDFLNETTAKTATAERDVSAPEPSKAVVVDQSSAEQLAANQVEDLEESRDMAYDAWELFDSDPTLDERWTSLTEPADPITTILESSLSSGGLPSPIQEQQSGSDSRSASSSNISDASTADTKNTDKSSTDAVWTPSDSRGGFRSSEHGVEQSFEEGCAAESAESAGERNELSPASSSPSDPNAEAMRTRAANEDARAHLSASSVDILTGPEVATRGDRAAIVSTENYDAPESSSLSHGLSGPDVDSEAVLIQSSSTDNDAAAPMERTSRLAPGSLAPSTAKEGKMVKAAPYGVRACYSYVIM